MKFHVVTLFPQAVDAYCSVGTLGRAVKSGLSEVKVWDLREFGKGKHRVVDDDPYGGGAGRTLTAESLCLAAEAVRAESGDPASMRTLAASASGRPLDGNLVRELAGEEEILILCGRYGGFDQRAVEILNAEEISIGDYVLTGGELAALVIVDSVARFIPGALGNEDSPAQDSFYDGLLGYPVYTRPERFRGLDVPAVYLSGDHARIAEARRLEQLSKTLQCRPDLLKKAELSDRDIERLRSLGYSQEERGK